MWKSGLVPLGEQAAFVQRRECPLACSLFATSRGAILKFFFRLWQKEREHQNRNEPLPREADKSCWVSKMMDDQA